jgi:phosphatidylserine decarboxylase
MQTLEKWLDSKEVKELQKKPVTELLTKEFFRDPFRPLYYNPKTFLAPADGIVLYAYPRIGPTKKIVEIKGKKFTVQDLLHDKDYKYDSLVIGIFMTVLDVHINRMPTNGYVSEVTETPYIFTHNTSMFPFEQDLLNELRINEDNLKYLFKNEKLVSTIYCPEIRGKYYIVQVADKDVDCCVNWGDGDILQQGERFGMIRWGSQVDLVIPLIDKNLKYEILVKPYQHVEGGLDKIISLKSIK